MTTLRIASHTDWLVLKHEGMVRDDHAIGAIQSPSGVFVPLLFGTHPDSHGCRPWSGDGARAKRQGIAACSLGN
jgi:hypothetical protein